MIPNQQPGLPTIQNKEQADIQGKAQAFLMSGDQIGFIGRLASEAPTEIAPVVNAARRMAKEAQAAQQPQGESITTAGMREVEQAQQQAQQQDPRQAAIAGLPMQKQMFAGKRAGGIVAFAGGGQPKFYPGMPGIQRGRDEIEERKRRLLEAEIEANKRGETIFKPKKNPGFIDFFEGESPITAPSLPPGQAYYPGIPGLIRGQQAAGTTPSLPEIEELSPALRSAIAPEPEGTVSTDTDYLALSDAKLRKYYADLTGNPNLTIEQAKAFERNQKEAGAEDSAIEKKDFTRQQQIEAELDAADAEKIETTDKELLGRDKKEIVGLKDTVNNMLSEAQNVFDSLGFDKPEKVDPKKFTTESIRAELQENGVNLDLLSDQANALAEEKLKLGKDKKEALAFFGLEAGLNILAGKDPNALVNIGAGASKAIPAYRKELSRIKDSYNDLRKEQNALAKAQNDQDMGIAKFSMKRRDKYESDIAKRQSEYQTLQTNFVAKHVGNQISLLSAEMRRDTSKYATDVQATTARERTGVQKEIALAGRKIENEMVALQTKINDPNTSLQEKEKARKEQTRLAKLLSTTRASGLDLSALSAGIPSSQPTVDVSRLENQPGMNRITP